MKAASIQELKQELVNLPQKDIVELCLRLAKYKKENKELLNYLLFESYDQHGYMENVKKEMDEAFRELPKSTPYQNKKSLRKILKTISRYTKFMSSKQSEAELLIYFCQKVKHSGIRIQRSAMLTNLYNQQIKKIESALESLHEDLRFDYTKQLGELV
jgi:hypothetical protein